MKTMKNPKIYSLPYKRKKSGKTDYRKRLKLLSGGHVRFVVRPSLKHIMVELVKYAPTGDTIILTVHSSSLKKFGWKTDAGNTPCAYLTGYLAGKKAVAAGIKNAILDIGMRSSIKGSRLYAVVAGALEAGLRIPHGTDNLPSKDRLTGVHIVKYAESLKGNKQQFDKQFSKYLAQNIDPLQLPSVVSEVREKITKL